MLTNNPILDSVLEIIQAEVKEQFWADYKFVSSKLPPEVLEKVMADMAVEIQALMDQCKAPITPVEAAMLMCMTGGDQTEFDPEFVKQGERYIRAAAVWMTVNLYVKEKLK